jgi:DNA-directed RNA polymerase subunit L
MEINIIKDEKNDLEVEVNSQTMVELVRVYLNKDSAVKLGAWKKPHYSKPFVLKVKTEGKAAKKALQDAITLAQKELGKYKDEFKKAK